MREAFELRDRVDVYLIRMAYAGRPGLGEPMHNTGAVDEARCCAADLAASRPSVIAA
ncbi:hypothetical protein SGFS_004640 [Streptomyces graminofaciens]|jgi:hypothetical protein|uniref:Uncharacterized protein n=1 Tax=Streptomyces graminofaciens TaxID=68212 RepID=A0ABN5V8G1_9ACTN|nr:hypothetical protein SGFS_004640 [Streptomyces graminofaciens]